MWAIIKKEVKSYFLSPIGYIYIGLFLIMCSIFFYLDVYSNHTANFENIFYSLSVVLTFIVPILTMRIFSEERKNGTEQLLLTSGKSITSIVLAKFISAVIISFIAEVLTFMYFFILLQFGQPHFRTALASILGFLLLTMAYISFGIFASSITENQIIAGVITMGVFILFWFLPGFNSVFSDFSLIGAFRNSFINGVITIKSTVLLLSFTLMFILFTIMSIQRRKSVK